VLAFAEAAHFGAQTPLRFATIEQPVAIAIMIAAAVAGYWLGSLSVPRWSTWIVGALWLTSLTLVVLALGTYDIECSIDPHTRINAMRIWVGVLALAVALACPAFLGRQLHEKHVVAVPVSFGFAALGLLIAFGVAFDWLTRPCIGVVY
jgi:hypothetical protein